MKGLSANVFGWVGIVCSLVPWVLFITAAAGWFDPGPWFTLTMLFFVTGIALTLIAAAKGSRRWALAALFPLASIFLLLAVLHYVLH